MSLWSNKFITNLNRSSKRNDKDWIKQRIFELKCLKILNSLININVLVDKKMKNSRIWQWFKCQFGKPTIVWYFNIRFKRKQIVKSFILKNKIATLKTFRQCHLNYDYYSFISICSIRVLNKRVKKSKTFLICTQS